MSFFLRQPEAQTPHSHTCSDCGNNLNKLKDIYKTAAPSNSKMENEFFKGFSESYAMKRGEGPHSYAQNSTIQRTVIEAAKSLILGAIANKFDPKTLSASSTNSICIADLGCSTGPNTFIAVQHVVEAIELQYQSYGVALPQFQVFFNDQVSNDFNTLFKTLPSNRKYFAAGVPGSFYGPLFPRGSLHLVYSSASLNWMSNIPKEITDTTSAAWNKGRIHYANAPKQVVDAYARQHKMDMEIFLHARAQELVGNGLMALQIPDAHDAILDSDLNPGKDLELLGTCLVDMAKEGKVNEEKVDSFNLPLFFSPLRDLKKILESNGDFSIEQMETIDSNLFIPDAQMFVSRRRATVEGLIENHFGDGIVDELFDRYTKKVTEFPDILDPKKLNIVIVFVFLKRKLYA